MGDVVDIGKARTRAAEHTCHAIGCNAPVKPERLMCLAHWRRVPHAVQDRVLATYRPGQCDDWEVSEEYCAAAHAAVLAVAQAEGRAVTGDEPELRLYQMLSPGREVDEQTDDAILREAGIDPEVELQRALRLIDVAEQRALALRREPRVDLLAWRAVLQAPVVERDGDPPSQSGVIEGRTHPDWRFPFPLRKVVSGGQTGADMAGLIAARRLGLETGGWAPKGWRTTRGVNPGLAALGLREHTSSEYGLRTAANARDSDGTVCFVTKDSPGEKRTRIAAAAHSRPYCSILTRDLGDAEGRARQAHAFVEWIYEHKIHALNIAGNSEETDPKIGGIVENFLMLALAPSILARLEQRPIEAPTAASPPPPAPPDLTLSPLPDLALPNASLPNLTIAAGDDFILPTIVLTDDQRAAVKRILRWAHGDGPLMLSLTGFAGCHAAGQELLLWDGTIKRVENITVGDRLMGPDSAPRTVQTLARGSGQMVTIRPVKGDPFVVNLDHILTLIRSYAPGPATVDVSVREWLTWSRGKQQRYKLWRAGVQTFGGAPTDLRIDPYFVGLLLGDGSLRSAVTVFKPDPEVRDEAYRQAQAFGLHVREVAAGTSSAGYRLAAATHAPGSNNLIRELRALGLYPIDGGDKFVPLKYRTASRQARLQLLAGLMDSDGSLTCGGFDFVNKSPRLAADAAFLARSVGLAAYMKPCRKGCQTGAVGDYWRVSISGDCAMIPTRLPRKQAAPRRQIKSVSHTGFTVEPAGEAPYFGFALDGDGRYLMADFTVTHNTGKTSILRELAPDMPSPTIWAGMTGKAATRLACLARVPARTLHSVFYEPPEEDDGALFFSGVRQPIVGGRSDGGGGEKVRVLVIDESSMVSPSILDDLQREWVAEGVRVLFVGDPFQLPPVLDKEEEARHGRDFSVFERVKGPALWHVHRAQGGILGAATAIRTTGRAPKVSDGSYTYRETRVPLLDAVAAYLHDPHDHVLITWRNELRMIANQKIRGGLGRTEVFPQVGDTICAKKNAQFGRVLNGEVYRVRAIEQGPWMADVMTHWIQTEEGPSILATCAGRKVPMDGAMPWISNLRSFRAACESDGAVEPIPITWGYCLSTHSAQGSEYRRVTVFLAGDYAIPHFNAMTKLPDGSAVRFSSRLLYTAITRAREHVSLYTTPTGR